MQRAGYLETDQERDIRVETEHKAAMSRIQAESDQRIRKSQADVKAAFEMLLTPNSELQSEPEVLIKEPEKNISTRFNENAIRLDGAALEVVKKNIGGHSGHLFWVDSFATQMQSALGKEYLDVMNGLSGPSSTVINGQGDYYFGDACMAHNCQDQESAIAIHKFTGEVVVGLRIEKKVKVFGVVDASHLPAPIKTWLAALQY